MNYTREQAEEVLKDWNEFDRNKRGLSIINHSFLDHKFPKKVSGWYRTMGMDKYLIYFDFEKNICYGFDYRGQWYYSINTTNEINPSQTIPSTPQEVEQRLIEEAKRRGYVEGVKYRCLKHPEDTFTFDGCYIIGLNPEEFALGTDLIFYKGKWAEIIEQPETELSRTIKKAEKIVDKLNHLLSL